MDVDDPENVENIPPEEEPANNADIPPPVGEDQPESPPAKKKRIRKTKGKKHQVGAKVKNRNQRNYHKEPANVPLAEAEVEEPIFEDQPGYELQPLPDVPEQSKY